MKALWKKTAILLLGFSNLAVLGTVFHTYFENQSQPFKLFSSSDDSEDLKKKIQTECKEEIQKLIEGDQQTYTCYIKLNRKQRGARYKLGTEINIIKKGGGGFKIKYNGRMTDRSRHATEAAFCNDCDDRSDEVQNNSLEAIMSAVIAKADEIYEQAETAVTQAERTHNEKDRKQRMAKLKERRCEGKWDQEEEEIVEFDVEERLNCKMDRMSSLDLPLEIEEFYHKDFKRELWKTALSDEDYILEELLEGFNEPYRYPFSVRASTGLMKSYLSWKEDFSLLDSVEQKNQFVNSIQRDVQQMTSFMSKDQAQRDLFYLNQGFDNAFSRIQQLPTSPSSQPAIINSPSSTGINYNEIKKQVAPLYN